MSLATQTWPSEYWMNLAIHSKILVGCQENCLENLFWRENLVYSLQLIIQLKIYDNSWKRYDFFFRKADCRIVEDQCSIFQKIWLLFKTWFSPFHFSIMRDFLFLLELTMTWFFFSFLFSSTWRVFPHKKQSHAKCQARALKQN